MTAVDDAPTLDLDGDDSTDTGSDYRAAWTDNGPVRISDTDFVLDDVDDSHLDSLAVTLTNLLDSGSEILAADTTGTSIVASYDGVSGVLTLTGSDTIANYRQVLATVTYDNGEATPNTTDRVIEVVANDGALDSLVATTTLTISDETVAGISVTAGTVPGSTQTTVWSDNVSSWGTLDSGSVAMNDSGRTVVVWSTESDGSVDGDGSAVMVRIYDELGNAIGQAFQVNTTTAGNQDLPSVAMDDNGDFVVVWHGTDSSGDGIFAQRFDANGIALGGEFRVNTTEAGSQYWAAVDMNAADSSSSPGIRRTAVETACSLRSTTRAASRSAARSRSTNTPPTASNMRTWRSTTPVDSSPPG